MDRAVAYLTIPADYGRTLCGLRWSPRGDAVEDGEGRTLALTEQVALVLEGVFSRPAVPPFAFVLNVMSLMRHGTSDGGPGALWRLRAAFEHAQGPGISRNVGILIGELCRDLPAAAAPPSWRELDLELKRLNLFGEPLPRQDLIETPPFGRQEFERRLNDALQPYDGDTLLCWLKHGCAPANDGRKLAEALVSPPPARPETLTSVLRCRSRLAGALALMPALSAAMTLPQRRPRADALPQGGYADVTTRGAPERLLPSQFALDRDDFVRRFAERELLYFRREEPHSPHATERLIVLDQGVRTWGGVRLALVAGVLALLGKDRRRAGVTRLALTSAAESFEPAALRPSVLADYLEASDLTPHPAELLARVFAAQSDDEARDIVFLTHPRNLRDAEVCGAIATRRRADRLFALAVDDAGRAELAEWRGGGAVTVRTFRVDLAGALAVQAEDPVPLPAAGPAPWTGDVEPVGFPFRAGLVTEPKLLGFDAGGEWLVAVGRDGAVHALKLDGSAGEVLPRAFRNGAVLRQVEAVLGVAGGVVVGGQMSANELSGSFQFDSSRPPGKRPAQVYVAAHYQFARRQVTLHLLRPVDGPAHWAAFPDLHSIVIKRPWKNDGWPLDLETGARRPDDDNGKTVLAIRARAAWERAKDCGLLPPTVAVYDPDEGPWPAAGGLWLERRRNGRLKLSGSTPTWSSFTPLADGQPLLAGIPRSNNDRAELSGDVLALAIAPRRSPRRSKLYLFRGPDGTTLGEYHLGPPDFLFRLSPDGRRLARQTWVRELEVTDTADSHPPMATLRSAALHTNLHIDVSPACLVIGVGRFAHLFFLAEERFHHRVATATEVPVGRTTHSIWSPSNAAVIYDPARFRDLAASGPWRVARDTWGQVILMDAAGRLIATFLVRRELAAVSLPDGTRWGSSALLGGPVTPDAAMRIGRALRVAAEGGGP